jgi:hypothetical protein
MQSFKSRKADNARLELSLALAAYLFGLFVSAAACLLLTYFVTARMLMCIQI